MQEVIAELRWLAHASARAALMTGQELHVHQARAFAHALKVLLRYLKRAGEVESDVLDDGTEDLIAALNPKILRTRREQIARQFPSGLKRAAAEVLNNREGATPIGDDEQRGPDADVYKLAGDAAH